MMHREHPGEAMTGKPGAFPSEAIRNATVIVALQSVGDLLLMQMPRVRGVNRAGHAYKDRFSGSTISLITIRRKIIAYVRSLQG